MFSKILRTSAAKNLLMKKLLSFFTLLLFSALLFSGCHKDDDEDTAPKTGSIKAMVAPAGSATFMRVTQGNTTLEIAPNNGFFQTDDNLQAGDYSVTFTPATGFQAPAARNATVTGGNTTDLGTVTLMQPGALLLGTMSATVNGNPWNSTVHAATTDTTSITITGTSINPSGSAEAIALSLPNVTGPGTFTGPFHAIAVYTVASLMGGTQNMWVSVGPGTSCTVNITNLDMAAKKISGTYSFTAAPAPNSTATGTKTITNGRFTNLNIQ